LKFGTHVLLREGYGFDEGRRREGCAFRMILTDITWTCKVKGKSVPLQAWSGPEGSRNLRFPDFMTTAQDGGKVVSLTHRPPLPPENSPGTHFC